jgi:hypothetical protein
LRNASISKNIEDLASVLDGTTVEGCNMPAHGGQAEE